MWTTGKKRRIGTHSEARNGGGNVKKKRSERKSKDLFQGRDYEVYHFTRKEWLLNIAWYMGIEMMISLLFYRSWIAVLLFMPGLVFFLRGRKKSGSKNRKRKLNEQFLTGMKSVSRALSAGYSVENSVEEALSELKKVYEKDDDIVCEFQHLVFQLKVNRNLEDLLMDLAKRSKIEDIQNFAQVFFAAKRTGGDLIEIIHNTVLCITQKEETRVEIETSLSAKQLEQKIMSGVPCMILIYVGVASPEFLDAMYHNPMGVCVMSGCLLVYLGSFLWAKKIVDIEV